VLCAICCEIVEYQSAASCHRNYGIDLDLIGASVGLAVLYRALTLILSEYAIAQLQCDLGFSLLKKWATHDPMYKVLLSLITTSTEYLVIAKDAFSSKSYWNNVVNMWFGFSM
jgi:hypothetical protein